MADLHIRNTTNTVINISDLSITIPPLEEIDILENISKQDLAVSDDILPLIVNGSLVVNDGNGDHTPSEAIRVITGYTIAGVTDRKSGKIRVHQTSRQFGTYVYFTGAGDDPSNPKQIGNGERFIFQHKIGDPLTVTKYYDFNTLMNETYIHEAYITWDNAKFDSVNLDFVSVAPSIEGGVDTNFNLYDGYLIVPAAGDGNINITSDITTCHGGLFECKANELGVVPQGFWDADGNIDTARFENIRPAPTGDGQFNMFATELHLARLVNKIPLLGNGFQQLQSSDVDIIPHGLRMKITVNTHVDDDNPDHEWSMAFMLVLHRTKSVFN